MEKKDQQLPNNPEQVAEAAHGTSMEAAAQDAQAAAVLLREQVAALEERTPASIVHEVKARLRVDAALEDVRGRRAELLRDLREAAAFFEKERPDAEPSAEQVEARADYQGNWTQLQQARLEHPLGYVKFVRRKLLHLDSLRAGTPSFLEKPAQFQAYCLQQVREYDQVLAHVSSGTQVREGGADAVKLGTGKYRQRPTVFADARTPEGKPLTARQRGIIESHEFGHGVREFLGGDAKEIRESIDPNLLPVDRQLYFNQADEIAERMAQLKNYFGMSATDVFTVAHLDHARRRYVADTGLDNDMDALLRAIPEDRKESFVRLMNELPL